MPWAHLPLNPGGPFLINRDKLLRASAEDLRRGQTLRAITFLGQEWALQSWVAGGNMGLLALEPHLYLSPSLGPCCLPSDTPKRQVGSLLTCLSLSRRRASESSLSSESSEASDAGEAQGYQGTWGGGCCLGLSTSLLIRLTFSPQPGGPRSLHLPTSGGAHHTQPRLAELGGALWGR